MASKLSVQPRMLLATALVSILDSEGRSTKCRVLLDSASQANFISESCVRRLNLTRKEYSTPVVGINGMSSNVSSGKVSCVIFPYSKPYPSFNLEAIVIPQICEKVPQIPAVVQKWKYLENLCLAEPLAAHDEMEIDLLLGVEVFGEILRSGYVRGQNGGPHAINTVFGWVLMGKLGGVSTNSVLNFLTSVGELDCTLKKFWEIESIPKCVALSEEEQQAEEFFTSSCWRMDSGRYVVKLPFPEFPPVLGDSYSQALHRFKLLEGRFRRDSVLHEAYCDFMADYLEQGHMSEVGNQVGSNSEYYIPHHAVVKRNANGEIKLRTVFDASAKTTNGKSLNDVLLAGPKLQNDIVSILLSFRLYLYVFTADIRQMYRQILVEESHTSYQTILWRPNGDEPIRKYQLKTVTYGVTSSPFLAIRTLLQLCRDEGERFPLAVNILENFCYVDDAIGVANSKEIALDTQNQLIELLALGKFELRKWASNCSEVLAQVPEVHQQPLVFDKDSLGIKVLGLQWCPTTDCFSYSVHPQIRSCTKRNILSEIARLYDPLGFLAPVIIVPKQILQQLWALGIGWDDEPPLEVANQWKTFVAELPELSSLKIPRHILHIEAKFTEIHAFCDASEKSYAAVVYLRQVSTENSISVHLVCAKTRVAPLKRLSIPRLELCAALLAAELIDCVSHIMVTQKIDNVCAWTDSKVVVTWVKSSPHRWRSFVANRVAIIQEKVAPDSWYHVVGKENPSDCASRGTFPRQFLEQPLWWEGPTWLKLPRDDWPVTCVGEPSCTDVQEEAKVVCITIHGSSIVSELLNRYSSLRKIERVVAYCLRFRKNCLCRKRGYPREIGNLSEAELYEAMVVLVKDVQRVELDNELRKVRRAEVCPKAIQKLAPFIDSQGVLRVGGRLRQSSLSYDRKHPILLPRKHRLTYLIIQSVHNRSCHPGPQTLHYLLRQRYWILSAKRAIASVLSRCIKCFRVKPPPVVPIMSDLPSVRISEVKPFSHSGVDLFGPLRMSLGKRRGISSQKVYVCLFVCMATKAIHLEVVSDLTSEAVLAALRRFIGRRGRCSTNFVGAYKTLQLLGAKASEALQIKWHFNPPASPSFGGIWESGVKSVKTHLRRVIGAQVLTYEELSTTLIQIEAMLNSRPLCSLSSDPNDVGSLTPGHFLTLEPLNAPPDEDLLCVKHSRLNRWQLVQQMQQHFWRRWHMEYLHTLQQRHKWNTPHNPPSVGQLVLLKDENTRPLQWPLGRIIKLYPGTGNISRVAQEASPSSYFAVFDGHAGVDAAAYSAAHLHQFLAESDHFASNPKQALYEAFCTTDTHFADKCKVEHLSSGTTAVVALLRPKEKTLYVAWAGDSQALLVNQGKLMQLVNPHKPGRPDEKDRIERNGGSVLLYGTWRVNGQLAVSRAIGWYQGTYWMKADLAEIIWT
ncbi:unnamed protein product [Callosobruchus maculatus]|uniref:PPM-type phosphatase domain-containing protein n=1 Tax=Callosobruchus maculatus TaxID=64391 RepID=A0A653D5K7_CALMS|nr:unnamed protein product [Callosobruchus maculatus]